MATKKTKTTAVEPVETPAAPLDSPAVENGSTATDETPAVIVAAEGVKTTDDAMFVLDSPAINATAARIALANACGRSSQAAQEMASLKTDFDAAVPRSAVKTALRVQMATLKSEMDAVRAKARAIIDAAALEYQQRAEENKVQNVEETRDSRRARFLKLRDWLAENDADWLAKH
jgi:hypothetical protein